MKTVADGFHPGSEVANMAVLGYDLPTVYEGRGVLEAASIGYDLKPSEMAMRCNLICVEGDILKNHSSGHITTEEADELIRFLNEKLGSDRIHFYTGVSYRHLLVVKGGDKRLDCTPPHDVPLHPFRPLMIKPEAPEAQETADLLNNLILQSQEILKDHPVNLQRIAAGKDPANSIWPWSPGYRPAMQTMQEMYGFKQGSVISAVDLIRGIGVYAGLEVIDVEGATGLRRKSACRPRSTENKRFRLSSCRSQRRSRTRRRCRSENPDHRKPGQTSHRYPLRGIAEMG